MTVDIYTNDKYIHLCPNKEETDPYGLLIALDNIIGRNEPPRPLILDMTQHLVEIDTKDHLQVVAYLRLHRECFNNTIVGILSEYQADRFELGVYHLSRSSPTQGRLFLGSHHRRYVRKFISNIDEVTRARCSNCKWRFMDNHYNACRKCKDGNLYDEKDWQLQFSNLNAIKSLIVQGRTR